MVDFTKIAKLSHRACAKITATHTKITDWAVVGIGVVVLVET